MQKKARMKQTELEKEQSRIDQNKEYIVELMKSQ